MARLMVPSTPATRGEVELAEADRVIAGPDGRFYLPSEDAKAEKDRVSDAVEQAALMAAPPPSKDEIRAAKAEQKAAEKAPPEDYVPEDPAAETTNPEPIEAASEQAANPPGQAPRANASRGEWEEYARSQGATDDDLTYEDRPLSRNELRDKYGLI